MKAACVADSDWLLIYTWCAWMLFVLLLVMGAVPARAGAEARPGKVYYFLDAAYTLGYAGRGDLERSQYNGKAFLKPSFAGELVLMRGDWGFSAGAETLKIKTGKRWEDANRETGFKLATSELHLGLSPGIFEEGSEEELYSIGLITVGIRELFMRPPEFNAAGLPAGDISAELLRFNEEESAWGGGFRKAGPELGWSTLDETAEGKHRLRLSAFYAGKKVGFAISSRGVRVGAKDELTIWGEHKARVYITPLSILGSFTFLTWDKYWFFNYALLGVYF